jgi:hypothetical protein
MSISDLFLGDQGHIYEALASFRPRKPFVRQAVNNRVNGDNRLTWSQSCEGFVNMAPGLYKHKFPRDFSSTDQNVGLSKVVIGKNCTSFKRIRVFSWNDQFDYWPININTWCRVDILQWKSGMAVYSIAVRRKRCGPRHLMYLIDSLLSGYYCTSFVITTLSTAIEDTRLSTSWISVFVVLWRWWRSWKKEERFSRDYHWRKIKYCRLHV